MDKWEYLRYWTVFGLIGLLALLPIYILLYKILQRVS